MKWILIILLLVNVVYFGWELDRQTRLDVRNSVSVRSISSTVKQLDLITEGDIDAQTLKPASAPIFEYGYNDLVTEYIPEEEMPETQDNDTIVGFSEETDQELVLDLPDIDLSTTSLGVEDIYCFTFGPLAEEIMATGLSEWFTSRGVRINKRSTNERGKQLFWMYLAPKGSLTDAMATVFDLRDKGISDYRLISRGDLENAISMGLFSSQATVNRRLKELEKKGYNPIVVPYYDEKSLHWVDVQLSTEVAALETVIEGFPSMYNYITVDCGTIAMSDTNF